MSLVQVPLKAVPAQSVAIVLSGQNCIITLRQIGDRQYLGLSVDGAVVCQGILVVNAASIVMADYAGFAGELIAIDQQGFEAPQYTGWGSRWVLLYNDNPLDL